MLVEHFSFSIKEKTVFGMIWSAEMLDIADEYFQVNWWESVLLGEFNQIDGHQLFDPSGIKYLSGIWNHNR